MGDAITVGCLDVARQLWVVTSGVDGDVVAPLDKRSGERRDVDVLTTGVDPAQGRKGTRVFRNHGNLHRTSPFPADNASIRASQSARNRSSEKCCAADSLAAFPARVAAAASVRKYSKASVRVVTSALTTPASCGTTSGAMVELTDTTGMPRYMASINERPNDVHRAVCRYTRLA